MQITYEDLHLGNLGGPEFQALFRQVLADTLERMRDPNVVGSTSVVKSTIGVEAQLEYCPDSGAFQLCPKIKRKLPEFRTRHQSATVVGGTLMVEAETPVEQGDMFREPDPAPTRH